MCILLEHANHKKLLTSTNNGIKALEIAVTASKWETRCCINIYIYIYYAAKVCRLEDNQRIVFACMRQIGKNNPASCFI